MLLFHVYFFGLSITSNKKQEGESDWEMEQRRKARCVWLAGRKGVTELEAATAIINEAKTIIQQELGIRIRWQSGAANASITADGCESAENLSASRTVLQRSKFASTVSRKSPPLSSRSSSASSRVSPSTSVEQGNVTDTVEDSETSPSSSKRKRKSAGGREVFETPVAVSRSRSWSRRSAPRRTSGRGNMSHMKSPPSGGGNAGSRSNLKSSAHSPQDVSFFGHIVVSPPPSLRRLAQNAPSPLVAGNSATMPVDGSCTSSSTPKTSFHDACGVRLFSKPEDLNRIQHTVLRPGANQSSVGTGGMRQETKSNHLNSESSQCASATSVSQKAACGPGTKDHEPDKQHKSDTMPHTSSHREVDKGTGFQSNNGDSRNSLGNKHNNNFKKDTDSRSGQDPKSTEVLHQALQKETGCDTSNSRLYQCSVARAAYPPKMQDGGSAPLKQRAGEDAVTRASDKPPESAPAKPSAASRAGDHGEDEDFDNCFDDSLILNTQTDNLLLGRLTDSNSISDKSFENVVASTPLTPLLCVRDVKKDVSKLTQSRTGKNRNATALSASGSPIKENRTGTASKKGSHDQAAKDVGKFLQPTAGKTKSATVLPVSGSPIKEKGTESASNPISPEQSLTKVQVSAAPSGEPEPGQFVELKSVVATNQQDCQHQLVPSPPPPPLLDEDNFTEDMFRSPFVSLPDPSERQQQLSPARESARNKAGVMGNEDIHQNVTEGRHLQGREDVVTDTQLDSEADASAELIAASDYERLPYVEEGMLGDSADVSNQDLGIVRNSGSTGHLVCSERDPEEREEGRDDPEMPTLAGDLESKCAAGYNIQEDLAIAMNLSESFSASVNSSVLRTSFGASGAVSVDPVAKQNEKTGNAYGLDGFSTSFTSSMMEKAFADDSFSDPAKEVCPQVQNKLGKAASQKGESSMQALTKTAEDCTQENSTSKKESLQSLSARENSKNCARHKERNNSASQRSSRNSDGSTSGQNDGDFVPPTPPEETSTSVSSPCIRRTPLRACKTRGETSHPLGRAVPGSHTKERKRQALKNKENGNGRTCLKSQSSKKTPGMPDGGDDQQRKLVTQPDRLLQSRCLNLHPEKGAVSVTVQPADADSHGKNDAGNAIPLELDSLGKNAAGNAIPLELDGPQTQKSLCIIDVCANAELFATFVEEWRSQPVYAISVACEKQPSPLLPGGGIGGNFMHGRYSGGMFIDAPYC